MKWNESSISRTFYDLQNFTASQTQQIQHYETDYDNSHLFIITFISNIKKYQYKK